MERELHRPAKHSRFGRRAVAREGSHQVDAILVPAASRAGREDEKLAAVALHEVAIGSKQNLQNVVNVFGDTQSSLSLVTVRRKSPRECRHPVEAELRRRFLYRPEGLRARELQHKVGHVVPLVVPQRVPRAPEAPVAVARVPPAEVGALGGPLRPVRGRVPPCAPLTLVNSGTRWKILQGFCQRCF